MSATRKHSKVLSRVVLTAVLMLFFTGEVLGKTIALLVGVGTYDDPKIPDLACIGPDIDMMRRTVMENFGVRSEDLMTLTNRQATAAAVAEAFQKHLIERPSTADSVIFYFTGHGSRVRDDNGDEEDGYDEVLVTHGTHWTKPQSYITDDSLKIWLERLRCRKAMVVLDCCHSGTGTRSAKQVAIKSCDLGFTVEGKASFAFQPRQNGFQRVNSTTGAQWALVAACAADETALGTDSGSLLTREFCKQVQSSAGRPLSEIMKLASAGVASEASSLQHKQSPQLEGNTDVFIAEGRSVANPAGGGTVASVPASPIPSPAAPASTSGGSDLRNRPLVQSQQATPSRANPSDSSRTPSLPLLVERIQRRDFALNMEVVDAGTGLPVAGEEIRAGTRLQVRINSGRPGHLRLYHFDSAQRSTLVFPNKYQSNGVAPSNKEILIPGPKADFIFVVTDETLGIETLKAVCSTVPFDEKLDPPEKGSPFYGQVPLLPSETYRRGLGVQPVEPTTVGDASGGPEVAEAVVAYRVVK